MDNPKSPVAVDEFGPVRQLGHVVEDIAASIKAWEQQGVGPWLWMRNVRLKCSYLGGPSRPLIDVALSYRGDMQIELIQQHNDAPSPYLQTRDSGAFGLHHQAHLCPSVHRSVKQAEAAGMTVLCDIRMAGSRYVYLQSGNAKEQYVELLPASLMMRSMFKRGAAASARWQGRGAPLVFDLKNVATLVSSLPSVAGVWLRNK